MKLENVSCFLILSWFPRLATLCNPFHVGTFYKYLRVQKNRYSGEYSILIHSFQWVENDELIVEDHELQLIMVEPEPMTYASRVTVFFDKAPSIIGVGRNMYRGVRIFIY